MRSISVSELEPSKLGDVKHVVASNGHDENAFEAARSLAHFASESAMLPACSSRPAVTDPREAVIRGRVQPRSQGQQPASAHKPNHRLGGNHGPARHMTVLNGPAQG